jgi:hypothetical protein
MEITKENLQSLKKWYRKLVKYSKLDLDCFKENELQVLKNRIDYLSTIRQQPLSGSADASPKSSAWYCEKCGQEVDDTNVTYEETHDGCGGACR